jgi:hypothetical protein
MDSSFERGSMAKNILTLLGDERLVLERRLRAVEAAIDALDDNGGSPVRKRRMSSEARAKISAAAKKRWAKWKTKRS